MALSFEARNAAYGLTVRVNLAAEQSIPDNTSVVRITSLEIRSDSLTGTFFWTGTISIAGVTAARLTSTNVSWCAAALQPGRFVPIGNVSGGSGTIYHDTDGTKTIAVAIGISGSNTTTKKHLCSISGSATIALPTIPRVTDISAAPVTLGEAMTIELTKAAPIFIDALRYTCGNVSETIAENITGTSVIWQPPAELAWQEPNADTVPIELTVITSAGDSEVGSKSITVRCPIPDTMLPTIDAVTISDKRGCKEKYGSFVQNQSLAQILTRASGVCGSVITSIRVRCGNLSASGAETSFALPNPGTVPVTVTICDSRGRTAAAQAEIHVAPYDAPQVTISDICRCNSLGEDTPDGNFAKASFRADVTSLGGFNSAEYTLCRRIRGTDIQTDSAIANFRGAYAVEEGSVIFPANIDSSYEVWIAAADDFSRRESLVLTLPVAFALIDLYSETRSIGLGQRANHANTLSIGLDMKLYGHRITDLAAPEADSDAATRAYVDSRIRQLADSLGVTLKEDL